MCSICYVQESISHELLMNRQNILNFSKVMVLDLFLSAYMKIRKVVLQNSYTGSCLELSLLSLTSMRESRGRQWIAYCCQFLFMPHKMVPSYFIYATCVAHLDDHINNFNLKKINWYWYNDVLGGTMGVAIHYNIRVHSKQTLAIFYLVGLQISSTFHLFRMI